jgi:polysaccharide export outer membrane protein
MVISRHHRILLILLCLLTSFIFLGNRQVSAQEDIQENNVENAYRIDVGDVLEINVWQEPELTRGVSVRLDGRITLPLIGDVMAAGETTMGLGKILEEKIGEIIEEPTVTVILTASNSRVYYMVGNIGAGEYPLNTPINLLQAIAKAGGLGDWADRDNIIIMRRTGSKDEMISFDYDKLVKGKDFSQNIMVQYGDTIIVP